MLKPTPVSPTLSSNVTLQLALTTVQGAQGICVIIPAASTYGSGTLTLLARPDSSSVTPEVIDTFTTGGYQRTYYIGAYMNVYLTLTGATTPSITPMISQIMGGL